MAAPLRLAIALAGPAGAETQAYDGTLGTFRVGVLEREAKGDSARLSIRGTGAVAGHAVRCTDQRQRSAGMRNGPTPFGSVPRGGSTRGAPELMHCTAIPPETAARPDAGAIRGTLDPVSTCLSLI